MITDADIVAGCEEWLGKPVVVSWTGYNGASGIRISSGDDFVSVRLGSDSMDLDLDTFTKYYIIPAMNVLKRRIIEGTRNDRITDTDPSLV